MGTEPILNLAITIAITFAWWKQLHRQRYLIFNDMAIAQWKRAIMQSSPAVQKHWGGGSQTSNKQCLKCLCQELDKIPQTEMLISAIPPG